MTKARKDIFKLLEEMYDTAEEFKKISKMFNADMIRYTNTFSFKQEIGTIEKFFDVFILPKWKHRGSCLTCSEIKKKLEIDVTDCSTENIIKTLEYYSNIIILLKTKLDLEQNINFEYSTLFKMLWQNINILLEHLNYEIKEIDDEKVILISKNPAATAVAEISSQETAMAILQYHHASLKGQIEEKKKLLYSIAQEYEPLLSKGIDGFSDYFDKANNMLNNLDIRHNNKQGEHKKDFVANMKSEKLEKWYDELYQLLLFCVLIRDNKHRKDEISKFLKQVNPEQK